MDQYDPIWWHKLGNEWGQYWARPHKKARPQPGPHPALPDLTYGDKQRISSDSELFNKIWFLNKCWGLSSDRSGD